jgi:hypothetical protein
LEEPTLRSLARDHANLVQRVDTELVPVNRAIFGYMGDNNVWVDGLLQGQADSKRAGEYSFRVMVILTAIAAINLTHNFGLFDVIAKVIGVMK